MFHANQQPHQAPQRLPADSRHPTRGVAAGAADVLLLLPGHHDVLDPQAAQEEPAEEEKPEEKKD